MKVREITINDYENLISFWKENYFVSEMDSKEKFQLFLEKNPKLSILAEQDSKITGTILGSFDGRRGYIQKLVVEKTQRKNGIGKQLVERMLKKFKNIGVTYIPVNIDEKLVQFYENCGFKKTSQVAMNKEIK